MGARIAYNISTPNGTSKYLGSHWGGKDEFEDAITFATKTYSDNTKLTGEEIMDKWIEQLKTDGWYNENDHILSENLNDIDYSDYGYHHIKL